MRLVAIGIGLFAFACGGSTTSPSDSGADASADGAAEASPEEASAMPDAQQEDASCATILASSYDQTCTTDTDCVRIGEGDVCVASCAFACGVGGTINAGALPAYRADLARSGFTNQGIGCGCVTNTYGPCCVGGRCQQGSICLPTSTDADGGSDAGASGVACAAGEALCHVGCDGVLECHALPCPAIPPCPPPP